MKPTQAELEPYQNDRKQAAEVFQVSERTIIRWLDYYGLYQPKPGYGCGKLSDLQVKEIRRKFWDLKQSRKSLGQEYQVSQATIMRVIHNISHHIRDQVATVNVIYNPNTKSENFRI